MYQHRALPAGLGFALPFRLRLGSLLVPGLPAVGDLGQQGPDSFDVGITPKAHLNSCQARKGWERNFLGCDISVKCGEMQAQLPSYFAG